MDIKFSHYWSLGINPHIDLVTLNVFKLDGDSSYSTQSESQNHPQSICVWLHRHICTFHLTAFHNQNIRSLHNAHTSERLTTNQEALDQVPVGQSHVPPDETWPEFPFADLTTRQLDKLSARWLDSIHIQQHGQKKFEFPNPTP